MKNNKFIIGLGVSYNPGNVKRLETSGELSLQDLFSDYGSPSYNENRVIGFRPNPKNENGKHSQNIKNK